MEYTKGEWKLYSFKNDTKHRIRLGFAGEDIVAAKSKDDARLIAAAPDMYEGLKDALREICRLCARLNPQHESCTSCEEMERSRLPLAKAEGK